MEGEQTPPGPDKARQLYRYNQVYQATAEQLGRRRGNLHEKEFQSIVRVATANALKPEFRSPRDDLTELLKKKEFMSRIAKEASKIRRKGGTMSIIEIDLDGFKNLNDNYGHLAGDEALRLIAGALQKSVRQYDTVARLGGDEFGVLVANGEENVSDIIAQRLNTVLQENQPQFEGLKFLSASIGVAEINQTSANMPTNEMFERADIAMYNAKMKSGTSISKWVQGMVKPTILPNTR